MRALRKRTPPLVPLGITGGYEYTTGTPAFSPILCSAKKRPFLRPDRHPKSAALLRSRLTQCSREKNQAINGYFCNHIG
jgi:hypothetical protein